MTDNQRRTIRRYAHELYPHPAEGETRDLAVEVPYLYARAVGMDTWGTGSLDMLDPDNHPYARELGYARYADLVQARHLALIADALYQGLAGQEAWGGPMRSTWTRPAKSSTTGLSIMAWTLHASSLTRAALSLTITTTWRLPVT